MRRCAAPECGRETGPHGPAHWKQGGVGGGAEVLFGFVYLSVGACSAPSEHYSTVTTAITRQPHAISASAEQQEGSRAFS